MDKKIIGIVIGAVIGKVVGEVATDVLESLGVPKQAATIAGGIVGAFI